MFGLNPKKHEKIHFIYPNGKYAVFFGKKGKWKFYSELMKDGKHFDLEVFSGLGFHGLVGKTIIPNVRFDLIELNATEEIRFDRGRMLLIPIHRIWRDPIGNESMPTTSDTQEAPFIRELKADIERTTEQNKALEIEKYEKDMRQASMQSQDLVEEKQERDFDRINTMQRKVWSGKGDSQ